MKGFKKEIWVTFFIVAALGIFFQLNRLDAFLHINPWSNNASMGEAAGKEDYAGLPRERVLVIYDAGEVQSVLRRHMIEKILTEQKKEAVRLPLHEAKGLPEAFDGIVVATNRLRDIPCLPKIEQYVAEGGTVLVLSQLQDDLLTDRLRQKLGGLSAGQEHNA